MRIRLRPIFLAIVAFLALGRGARAHAPVPVDASPAPGAVLAESPESVVLVFEEELVSGLSTIQVLDANDAQVDDGSGGVDLEDPEHATLIASLPKPLPEGVYTVVYTVVLLDGDRASGSYRFAVGLRHQGEDLGATITVNEVGDDAGQTPSRGPWSSSLWLVAVILAGLFLLGGVLFVIRSRSSSSPRA